MAKVKIIGNGVATHVYVDDVEVKGVVNYSFGHKAGEIPVLVMTVWASEIEIEQQNAEIEKMLLDIPAY